QLLALDVCLFDAFA
ncbi:DUF645 family protein, partial [Vibrio cholerae]|nr:DUF645 family protein [Vibrio cholerae]HDI3239242.1 DUF645 family protein [Vibrio cholerae]